MNLPKFAAEAAVYETTGQYCGAATFSTSARQVLPAICCQECPCGPCACPEPWECPPSHPKCFIDCISACFNPCVECLRNCKHCVCEPSCGPCQKSCVDTNCAARTLPCDASPQFTPYSWCEPTSSNGTTTCYSYDTSGTLSTFQWIGASCGQCVDGLAWCIYGEFGLSMGYQNCVPPPCAPGCSECLQECTEADCRASTVQCS